MNTSISNMINIAMRFMRLHYSGSSIRFIWTFINPLMLAFAISFIFSQVFGFKQKTCILDVFSGYLLWHFFSSTIMNGHRLYLDDRNYYKKITKGKHLYLAGFTLFRFITALPGFLILSAVCAYINTPSFLQTAVSILIPCIALICVFSITQIIAVCTVFCQDITHALDTSMLFWLWLSPVFYSVDAVPEKWRLITILNPASWILDAWKYSLGLPYCFNPAITLFILLSSVCVIFIFAATYYHKHAKEMSNLL